jgi:hypothetical protein
MTVTTPHDHNRSQIRRLPAQSTFGAPDKPVYPVQRNGGQGSTVNHCEATTKGTRMDEDLSNENVMVLPPIPICTGTVVEHGTRERIVGVEVVVTTADGNQKRIAMTEQHGAWWPPSAL